MLQDSEFQRHIRHILLPHWTVDGYRRIKNAKILIVGLGGLGSVVSQYIAAAGFGTIYISDADIIEPSNLTRQILYNEQEVGQLKTEVAYTKLQKMCSHTNVVILKKITEQALQEYKLLHELDLIIDCCDSLQTKLLLNVFCVDKKIPFISGSAIGFSGQHIVFLNQDKYNESCLQCLYNSIDYNLGCSSASVFSPILGMIASMQSASALHILTKTHVATGVLSVVDAFDFNTCKLYLKKNDKCKVCALN